MVEIGADVIISHLFGQSDSRFDVTSPLREICDEVFYHEANVAVCRDTTVRSLTLSQLLIKLLDQYDRVLLHEDLLNQDQAFFKHSVMLAYTRCILQQLKQL